jgi:hypothetical protein
MQKVIYCIRNFVIEHYRIEMYVILEGYIKFVQIL